MGLGYRFKVLQAMDEVIRRMNDERAYEEWISVVPDGADVEEILECAADDDVYGAATRLFPVLVAEYSKGGW